MMVDMADDDLLTRARGLGATHAELASRGRLHHQFSSGREVAVALGVAGELDGDQYVALHDEYLFGWSAWA